MSELITIVNEQGLVTGSKERYEVGDDDLCLSIGVWLEDAGGNALIAQRSPNMVVSPNLWSCAVEGMVDYGDDVVGTAHKEVREEMGLQVGLVDLCDKIIHPSSHGQRYKHLFRALFNELTDVHPAL
ncbi:MAG TPA: NUDIX domain-containing protein, partial [Candidatus Saccharimonadales bacterium]|nr:NUDIX domain-containing protein [Candidatus Saccharimonadales bacterium]